MADERIQRRLAAILAADVVGYSRLMESDEEGTRARLRALHAELIGPRIVTDGGRIVKTTGDGILVEFPSAVDAVRNALAIQSAMAVRNAQLDQSERMLFRVGVNLGDVIIEDDDIHGEGVNVAARLEALCEPGAVYVSAAVHDQVAGKIAAAFDDRIDEVVGDQRLPRARRRRHEHARPPRDRFDGVSLKAVQLEPEVLHPCSIWSGVCSRAASVPPRMLMHSENPAASATLAATPLRLPDRQMNAI